MRTPFIHAASTLAVVTTLAASPVTPRANAGGGAKGNVCPDVMLEKGTDASVLLLAPLQVRLPVR